MQVYSKDCSASWVVQRTRLHLKMWQWQVGTADNPISDQGTSTAADNPFSDQGTSTAAYTNMIDTQPNVRNTIGRVTMRYEKC